MSFTPNGSGRRVAIVDGMRTPFARAWTTFKDLGAADLGGAAVRSLLTTADIDPREVEQLFFGCVAATPHGPHIGREVVFRTPIRPQVPAVTVQLYCASAARAVVDGANEIAMGNADVVVAGGAESMSEAQALWPKKVTHALQRASKARTLGQRLGAFKGLHLRDLKPESPGIAEPTTGQSMGESAEIMAKDLGVRREDQDAWALESHRRSAAAYEAGRMQEEVCALPLAPSFEETVARDTDVRTDTSLEQLARLRPVFDRKYGTVTAGNSSPLTDGAAAVLLMSEQRARDLGCEPLAYIRSYAMVGVDLQREHLLLGPTYSAPIALRRAGMELAEMDMIEMHEAFACQVLATIQRFESPEFGRSVGLAGPIIPEVDRERLNPNGGSIAVGHPFGATGARVISQCAHEMVRRDYTKAFISICAAGGHGFSMVLVRE